jgi:hypothetical protein
MTLGISVNNNYDDTGKAVTFQTLDFRSVNYLLSSKDSSQIYKQKFLGQRWAFRIQSPPLLRSEAFEVMSKRYIGLNPTSAGAPATDMVPPVVSQSSGTASGTISVSLTSSTDPAYNYTKGSTTIAVTGGSGTLKKGDFIKFSDHDKVYQLTADTNLDGSSVDTVSIFPALFQTLTDGTSIGYNDVVWSVTNADGEVEIETDENGYYQFTINFIEEI